MPAGDSSRRYYPGLTPLETRIWRAFLVDHETEWESFEYHVYVGEGIEPAAALLESPDPIVRRGAEAWRQSTRKKIDVLGARGNETWIFEVEERPGTLAAGQLVSYQELLPTSRDVPGPIVPAIVAVRVEPDFLTVAQALGVFVWQVSL